MADPPNTKYDVLESGEISLEMVMVRQGRIMQSIEQDIKSGKGAGDIVGQQLRVPGPNEFYLDEEQAWNSIRKDLRAVTEYIVAHANDPLKLNKLNKHGLSALHEVVLQRRPDCLELLLRNGADPGIQCVPALTDGRTGSEDPSTPTGFLDNPTPPRLRFRDWNPEMRVILEMRAIFDFYKFALSGDQKYSMFASNELDAEVQKVTRLSLESIAIYSPYHEERALKISDIAKNPDDYMYPFQKFASNRVHLPFNNGPALLAIARWIQQTEPRPAAKNTEQDIENSKRQKEVFQFLVDSFEPPPITSEDAKLQYRDPAFFNKGFQCASSTGMDTVTKLSSVVFPYFKMWTRKDLIDRNKKWVILQDYLPFKGLDKHRLRIPMSVERTLDEAYYPGLGMALLERRNGDQVVSREHNPRSDDLTAPILMVPQIWLWRLGDVLITAYPPSSRSDLRIYEDDYTPSSSIVPRRETQSIDLQMALILVKHIDQFGMRDGEFLLPLDYFERAVATTLRTVEEYVDAKAPGELDIEKERRIIHCVSDVGVELDMIGTILQQQAEVLTSFLQNASMNESIGFDRLYKALQENQGKSQYQHPQLYQGQFQYQQQQSWQNQPQYQHQQQYQDKSLCRMWEDVLTTKQRSELRPVLRELKAVEEGWNKVHAARSRIDQYMDRVKKIKRDVERIEKTMESMLNLKRTYASIQEAKNGIQEARNSALLSIAGLGFAIVTIIFTPLGFLVSLFGMSTDALVKQQHEINGERAYEDWFIGVIFCTVEVGTLLFTAVLVAWIMIQAKEWSLWMTAWLKRQRREVRDNKNSTQTSNPLPGGEDVPQRRHRSERNTDLEKQSGN